MANRTMDSGLDFLGHERPLDRGLRQAQAKATAAKLAGPLAPLEKDPLGSENLQFPTESDSTEMNHYITFSPFRYSRDHRKAHPKVKSLARVILPLPSNLSTSYGVDWTSDELGFFGKRIADNAQGVVDTIGSADSVTDMVKSLADKVKGGFSGKSKMQMFGEIFAGSSKRIALKVATGTLSSASVGLGLALNPHIAMMFKGVNLRQHSFQYNFVARSEHDSQQLQKIITKIKVAMHPYYWNNSEDILNYPFMWSIYFSESVRDNLYGFNTCVLNSFNVSYNGQGFPVFFRDSHAPVNVTFEMSFSETEILTQDRILEDKL